MHEVGLGFDGRNMPCGRCHTFSGQSVEIMAADRQHLLRLGSGLERR